MDSTMEPVGSSFDYQALENFVENLIHVDMLDECFAGFAKISPEQDRITRQKYAKNLVQLLKTTPAQGIDGAIKFYVHKLKNVINHRQSETMIRLLEDIVEADLVKPVIICQAILSEEFDFKNEVYWTNGLNFIRRIIHTVKYKEVRDILASLLSKIPMIPAKCSVSVYRQMNAFYDLIALILDRHANLLPAYLVLDEIQSKFFVADHNGHWMFSRLFSVFVDSFRPAAKIISHAGRPQIMPVAGYCFPSNSLKLDEKTAKYKLKGLLPYDKELFEPQTGLLLQIMEQENSRDIIANVLSLSKTAKDVRETGRTLNMIEQLLIELIVSTIDRTCNLYKALAAGDETFENLDFGDPENDVAQAVAMWNHIATTALFFAIQYQSVCLPILLPELLKKLQDNNPSMQQQTPSNADLIKCREFFLWTLFQMMSWHQNATAAAAANTAAMDPSITDTINLISVLKLLELMYPEREPLLVPDCNKRNSVYIMAGASLCLFMIKNEIDNSKALQHIPVALRLHIDYLRTNAINPSKDFAIVMACNAHASNAEMYAKIYHHYFRENILDKNNSGGTAPPPVSMDILDSLTINTRKNLTDDIMNRFKTIVQNKSMPSFPCHLAETCCRLMSFTEIEMSETKTLGQLMITMLRNHGWNYLYNLLELYSYRLHRVNCSNQIQLLRQLYCKSHIAQINHIQLYSFMENAALKILYGFNCYEFIAFCMRSKSGAETYNFLPPDSEELYKIFVYTLARAIHITGTETLSSDKYVTWVNEILKEIKNFNTNLTWPSFTLQCFPSIISEFYQSNPRKEPNRNQLTTSVDEEYRRWKSITNQSELVNYFTAPVTPPLIYCILYKMLLDGEPIPPVSYKILDKIGVRALSNHLRTFTDFLVLQFAKLVGGDLVNKCRDAVNDLIWKCHIVTLDKLLLCLALRSFESDEAQVCFFIIQLLVIKNPEIKNRIAEFIKEASPEHWRQSNWAEVQASFQKKYPEMYYFHHLQDQPGAGGSGVANQSQQQPAPGSSAVGSAAATAPGTAPTQQTLIPSIFSNICLRLLPVFDVIMHRLIELPPCQNVSNFVVNLLDEHGCLYKFHSHPITFLYNTLHYYEMNLRERSNHKKKLVYTVVSAFNNIKPRNWAVTEPFLNYCQRPPSSGSGGDDDWNPGPDYYKFLIGRLVDTLSSSLQVKCPFPVADYRFNEFANVQSHALYVTCVEILALPGKPVDTANHLINVVVSHHKSIPRADIELWINAIGLIFTALPESYSCVLKDRLIELLKNPPAIFQRQDLNHLFDFQRSHGHFYETDVSYVLALSHSYWNHGTVGQLCSMPQFIREKIKPIVQTEEQLMVVCYFVGPFLQRLHLERTRCVIDIAHELFQMLDAIDKKCTKLNHIDTICDLFYHFKYRFIGTVLKKLFDEKIDAMRPELQEKLRFFSQVSEDSVTA